VNQFNVQIVLRILVVNWLIEYKLPSMKLFSSEFQSNYRSYLTLNGFNLTCNICFQASTTICFSKISSVLLITECPPNHITNTHLL
jgi:hypothetical protein